MENLEEIFKTQYKKSFKENLALLNRIKKLKEQTLKLIIKKEGGDKNGNTNS